jgi:hypothetical protein
VKILTLFLGALIAAASAWCQEDLEDAAPAGKAARGAFGGAVIKITGLADEFGLLLGGHGGWIIDHTFVIGGGVYGSLTDIDVEEPRLRREFEFGYGGVEVGVVIASHRSVHISVQALVGLGGLTNLIRPLNSRFDNPDDIFFVAEPGVSVMWRLTDYFRMGVGGGYRFVLGVDASTLNDAALSGASAAVNFELGRF